MERMNEKLKLIKNENRLGFMGHVIAGYPNFNSSYEAAIGISKGGADFLEIQFPFSDPFADGPTIEKASAVSLNNGIKISDCFDLTEKIIKNCKSSVLIMTYGNIAFNYGIKKFVEKSMEIGVEGFIIPDIPPENDEGLCTLCSENNLALIFLAAPGNSKKRINYLSKIGNGFIYTVARTGITGKKTEINEDVKKWLSFVRENSELPTAVGFGIKSSKQIEALSPYCDIAIAGSYFVKEITNCFNNNLNIQEELRKKTEELLNL